MNDTDGRPPPLALGDVMVGAAVATVLRSEDPRLQEGDVVEGMLGWQEYAVTSGRDLRQIDPSVAPISTALGVLGGPGLTAYFGLLDICRPRRGETVVVSGAAGAVGMLVGQIAKIRGCRVVGVTRSEGNTAWLVDELGLDAAFHADDDATIVDQRLEELCPDGIDVYFDTVGGALTDAVTHRLNSTARVSACGQISQDNLAAYVDRFEEGLQQLTRWLERGQIKYREEIARGLEAAPQAFIGMLLGRNEGKQLVQLSDR
jgi:NADPH-dependent curcumin reductase CurA